MNDVQFEYNDSWIDTVPRLGLCHRYACLNPGTSSCCCGLIVMVVEVLDHSSFHRELDQVERKEPNDIMHHNRAHKQIGDLPKPKRHQSKLPRSSGYR